MSERDSAVHALKARFERDAIEEAINTEGFQLWRLQKKAAA